MNPVPILGWDAPRHQWLKVRRAGIGASDIAALLGLTPRWCTPWKLWAIKTGYLPGDEDNDAAQLGRDLEPWLISMAPRLLDMDVQRTPHMLYRHGDDRFDWRQCSPDAFAADGTLVEAKTAKLAGWGDPEGWEDGGIPLAYELQARWQMHVMDRPRVHIVGLVAGLGLVTRTIERDLGTESELTDQAERWYVRHIIESEEPAVDGFDVEALAVRYQTAKPDSTIELTDPMALEWALAYKEARDRKSAAEKDMKEPKAKLQALIGAHTLAKIDGHPTVTWNPKKGEIDWERIARELAEQGGIELPDPETFRKPSGRQFNVK